MTLNGGKYLLSGYGFSNQGPYLIFDQVLEKGWERHNVPIIGRDISLTRYKARYCIGRYDLDDFSVSPCPDQSKLESESSVQRCPACIQANQFVPAFYNLDPTKIPDKQRRYNAAPHVVYLVYFGQDLFKVGISNHKRVLDRWREQGARRAVVIANAENAYEARKYEEMVRNVLNIPEAISSQKKRHSMLAPIDEVAVIERFDALRHLLLSKYQFPLAYEDVQNLDSYYFDSPYKDDQVAENLNTYADDITANSPLLMSGSVLGLVGSIIIVRNNGTTLLCDTKKFISHTVMLKWEIDPYEARAVQGALL